MHTWTIIVTVAGGLGVIAGSIASLHRYVIRPLFQLPETLREQMTEMIEAILLTEATEEMLRPLIEEIVAHESREVLAELRHLVRRIDALERTVRRT